MAISTTTIKVGTADYRISRSAGGIGMGAMVLVAFCIKVVNSAAVTYDHVIVAPLVAENLYHQRIATAARFALKSIVSAHHFFHMSLTHQALKSIEVGFRKVAQRNVLCVEGMTLVLRSTVYGIVLCTSMEFVVLAILGALQTANDSQSHHSRKVRVFAVGFLPTSPTRVAEDIDVRCPNGKPLILTRASRLFVKRVLGTPLVRGCSKYLLHQFRIEGGSHAYRLWENGSNTGAGIAVKRLTPPVITANTQFRDSGRIVDHQRGLLL